MRWNFCRCPQKWRLISRKCAESRKRKEVWQRKEIDGDRRVLGRGSLPWCLPDYAENGSSFVSSDNVVVHKDILTPKVSSGTDDEAKVVTVGYGNCL